MFLRSILMAQGNTVVTPIADSPAVLDGSSQLFTIADSADFTLGTSDWMMSIFAKWDALPSNGWAGITAQRIAWNSDQAFTFNYKTYSGANEFGFAANNSSTVHSWSSTPSTGTWYHYVLRRSGNNLDLFIDATKQTTKDITGLNIANSAQVVTIGSEQGSSTPTYSSYFDGQLGFYGFWKGTYSDSDVTDLYNLGDAYCYSSLPTNLDSSSGLITYIHLARFTGHTSDELTDQEGSNNATNVGSIGFTGSGLNVDCS